MAMNQLLNNRVGKSPKKQKKGCLFLILGSILALVATLLFILVVSWLTGVVIQNRHGDEAAYALMTIVKPCYGVAMLLFYGILTIWYISPSQEEVEKQNRSLARSNQPAAEALSRRTLWLITGGLLAGVLVTGAICVNTYRLVTPDGIRTYFFAETGRYEWRQVSAYTVDCDKDDGLSLTFTMRDGKKFEIMQGVNSATDKFKENYESVTHFAATTRDEMDALQVPGNVKHYDTAVDFYRGNYDTLWPYIAKLIDYEDLTALPDEIAPETEPGTEPDTGGETDDGTSPADTGT